MPPVNRFTTQDASAYLRGQGVPGSVQSLKLWRKTRPNAPRFIRVGGRIFYSRNDLDQFIAGVAQ